MSCCSPGQGRGRQPSRQQCKGAEKCIRRRQPRAPFSVYSSILRIPPWPAHKQHPSQRRRQNVSCYKSRRDVRAGGRSVGRSVVRSGSRTGETANSETAAAANTQQNKFRVEMRVACSVRNTAEHEHGSLMLMLMLLSQMLRLKIVCRED